MTTWGFFVFDYIYHMKIVPILIALTLLSCKPSTTDDTNVIEPSTTQDKINSELEFPQDYLGIYKGMLNITTSNGINSIPMEFHLLQTADTMSYQYKIYYGTERDERSYNLIKTNNPHLYLVDENNGIVLETAYADRTLYSTYEVMGNLLHCTEVFHPDSMEFMITMARIQDTTSTGNEQSAIVKNYPLSVMQKAVLFKE